MPVTFPAKNMRTTSRGLWIGLLLAALVAPTVHAQRGRSRRSRAQANPNPFMAQQDGYAREVARDRGPGGMLALFQLWGAWDDVPPAQTAQHLNALSANRRLAPERRAYIDILRSRQLFREGQVTEAAALIEELGFINAWQVAGPFDNEGKRGLAMEFGPEAARSSAFVSGATWAGKEREVGWRSYPDVSHFGYINFDAIYRPYSNVCGYAQTEVRSERAQPLQLWLGAGGAIKAWWNGELVHEDEAYRFPEPDRSVAMVGAQRGVNRLLVKVCVAETNWGFFARLAAANGGRAEGVAVSAGSQMGLPAQPGHGGVRLPEAPEATLAILEEAAAGDSPSASALFDLARFLAWTGADDPAEQRARQLAARAAELEPTIERLQLAARLSDQRGEVMGFVQRAVELAPNDPKVVLFQARVRGTSLHPEDAMPLIERVLELAPEGSPEHLEALSLRASMYLELDMAQTAYETYNQVYGRMNNAPGWVAGSIDYLDAIGNRDEVVRRREQVVAMRWDSTGNRRALLADALRRRELNRLAQHADALRQIAPDSPRNLRYLASVHEALGQTDAALQTYARLREMAPEDAESIVANGRLLLRLDQSDAAIDAFRIALRLRPQDAATRELLEQVQPQERPDERYAVDANTLLGRRSQRTDYPLTTLQNLTVNTVFENGLGSSFRQLAVQLHDDEGARRFRSYSIPFDPGSQRIDVRLARVYRQDGSVLEATQMFEQPMGEPWYRIYYDTRALVVLFPDLEAGDSVELRWRVDDVAHRNLFADYYGDLSFLQSSSPTRHVEYVLMTPKDRNFFFNEPALPNLERQESVEGDIRTVRLTADNVPAINSENGMPGMTEVAPYLHVSTYQTWEDVGRWYWGLIQDQLYADASLQETVAELVEGKTDLREKVIAIHNWVVENTRYVGLEFGIHGYKPYRVPQIVRRGFGDCKDKASLLYTMFREAGIDAHIILVRTRRNGRITDLPASLAVFDHAIAYVPDLDLYIDGTAEHSGVTELPQMDQGVTVLHVWPEGSELRRTPVLPPEQNRRERNLTIRLAADGSAAIRAEERILGAAAPGYRSTYQAEGTREDRLERALRGTFPGLEISAQSFGDLEDLEVPIELRYEGDVPQLAQRDGQTLLLAPSVLGDLLRRMARSPERSHPLELGSTSSYREVRTVELPSGARPGTLPSGGTATSDFGTLSLQVEVQGRRIVATTEFQLLRDRVSPREYPAFRRWVQEADQILRQRLNIEANQ